MTKESKQKEQETAASIGTVQAPVKAAVVETTAKVIEPTALALPNAPESVLDRFRGGRSGDQRITLPRVVVLQPMSQEVNRKDEPEEKGTLFNRQTKENFGTRITFIPIGNYSARLRIVQNVGLVCRSRDMFVADMLGGLTYEGVATQDCTVCKLKDWPKDRVARGDKVDPSIASRGPECTVSENFPALLVRTGEDIAEAELILLSMSKTSARAAADLKGMQMGSMASWETFAYDLIVRDAAGPRGEPYWFQDVKRVRKTTPEERTKATATLGFLAGKTVTVEGNEDEEVGQTSDTATAAASAERRF